MGDQPKVLAVLWTCTDANARKRLVQREIGSALDSHLASSAETGDLLQGGAPDWVHRIATDDRTAPAIAADVIGLAGWLSGSGALA